LEFIPEEKKKEISKPKVKAKAKEKTAE
jgi:hypothetical protein